VKVKLNNIKAYMWHFDEASNVRAMDIVSPCGKIMFIFPTISIRTLPVEVAIQEMFNVNFVLRYLNLAFEVLVTIWHQMYT
jgi:hypothetical protein